MTGAEDGTHAFLQWLREHGASVHEHLQLFATLPNGDRSIIATQPIAEGETLLRIPTNMCLNFPTIGARPTTDAAGDAQSTSLPPSSAAVFLASRDPPPSPMFAVALTIMSEGARRAESPWAPYLATLPSPPPQALISWPPNELDGLRGTCLEPQGTQGCAEIYEREVLPIIAPHPDVWPPSHCTAEAFEQALCLVQSRAFHLVADNWLKSSSSEVGDLWLIPGVDMVNHATDASRRCTELKFVNDAFVMLAERAVEKGEEVLHTYGDLSDAQLLQTFGFIDTASTCSGKGNAHDAVVLFAEDVIEGCKKQCEKSLHVPPEAFNERLEYVRSLGLLPPALAVDGTTTTTTTTTTTAICGTGTSNASMLLLPAASPLTRGLLTVAQLLLMPHQALFEAYKEQTKGAAEPVLLGMDFLLDSEVEHGMGVLVGLLNAVASAEERLCNSGVNSRVNGVDGDEDDDDDESEEQQNVPLVSPEEVQAGGEWRRKCVEHIRRGQRRGLNALRRQLLESIMTIHDRSGFEFDSDDEEEGDGGGGGGDDSNEDYEIGDYGSSDEDFDSDEEEEGDGGGGGGDDSNEDYEIGDYGSSDEDDRENEQQHADGDVVADTKRQRQG